MHWKRRLGILASLKVLRVLGHEWADGFQTCVFNPSAGAARSHAKCRLTEGLMASRRCITILM